MDPSDPFLKVRIRFSTIKAYNFMYKSLNSSNSVRFSIKSHNYSCRVAAILKNGRHFEYNEISDCHLCFS